MGDTKISSPPARPDTSSSYLRKIKKPLIERKRRERINNCLDQLKQILLDNIKHHGGTQVSKLDKADILEMTVSHLRQIQHQQLSVAMATSATAVQQFREGYTECANEAVRYMKSSRVYPTDTIRRVQTHFTNAVYSPATIPLTAGKYRGLPTKSECHTSPISVKTESPNVYECVSPVSRVPGNFSPLLMPAPRVKPDTSLSPNTTTTCFDTSAGSSTGNNTSADSGLSMTSRDADSDDDTHSGQRNVWRPF